MLPQFVQSPLFFLSHKKRKRKETNKGVYAMIVGFTFVISATMRGAGGRVIFFFFENLVVLV